MSEPSRDEQIAEHINSIAGRSVADVVQLENRLLGRSWPGGVDDRSEPGALGWMRNWRPAGPAPLPELCGCAAGRCLLCN